MKASGAAFPWTAGSDPTTSRDAAKTTVDTAATLLWKGALTRRPPRPAADSDARPVAHISSRQQPRHTGRFLQTDLPWVTISAWYSSKVFGSRSRLSSNSRLYAS